jgi:ornithine cyclodeaminase/alanine dehydrogenase-like protein (mu-crystallin family)
VWVYDLDHERARQLAADMSAVLGMDVVAIEHPANVARDTSVWITCTTARRWFLGRGDVSRGAFVAAVGADNPEKQEIEPELLATNPVVVDVLEQCATIGDLHHALAGGFMRRQDVRAELADVVSGKAQGRQSADEIVIFDSTGTALEDVAAARIVYERAIQSGVGAAIDLSSSIVAVTDRTSLHA